MRYHERMTANRSPWLRQLRADRPRTRLEDDLETDVAIVGAGIAGIATAFFALRNGAGKVAVLEAGKLAHGATGHNAGQVVSYFERGFASLVQEFGLERAADGQRAVEEAWDLLDLVYREAGLDIPFARFLGHAGLTSEAQVMLHLENNRLRREGGLRAERIVVADDAPFLARIPERYATLYRVVPRRDVHALLETAQPAYVACLSYPKGVINSALFCQEVAEYLLARYPDRFALYEHTPVNKVLLRGGRAVLDAERCVVSAERVVLCTNGFASFTIIDRHGLEVNTRLHHRLRGTVGYMSGYLETTGLPPTAISYLEDPSADTDLSYFYLTRRPYEEGTGGNALISVGGPSFDIDDVRAYRADAEFPRDVAEQLDAFVHRTYGRTDTEYAFTWHGLMGYTRNGVRMIGPDPRDPALVYNLGCNGVGILPSLHGGWKVAELLAGATLPPSIFDVPA